MKSKITDDKLPPAHLKRALEYVVSLCPLGSSNKLADQLRTNFWTRTATQLRTNETYFIPSHRATEEDQEQNATYEPQQGIFMYTKKNWLYRYKKIGGSSLRLCPLEITDQKITLDLFDLETEQKWILFLAMTCKELGGGTCDFKAALAVKYLWEHSEEISRIELVSALDFQHCYVIVNREGVLADYRTWGEHAWIIDPWYGEKGIVYPASSFSETIMKIKAFDFNQHINLNTLGYSQGPYTLSPPSEEVCRCICEINPQSQPYPKYKGKPLDHYFSVDIYPRREEKVETPFAFFRHLNKHKESMTKCFQEIEKKSFSLKSSKHSLFAHKHNGEIVSVVQTRDSLGSESNVMSHTKSPILS
ncbi:hypothetical protein J2N86_15220 (plasmid) [Legionella lytica]|uniref:Uncharacterized protein n=1 Tax=Legionella lytica TaxID=96232 RepID=A0ABY4YCI3_9GAMM|nr:hypothetical protein [Legionella lytica]USQ15310.1 hypothetical protein J2N86_15220 [Legionella lytica]